MKQWFHQTNGKVFGPFSADELKSLAATGGLRRDSLVRMGAGGTWVASERVRNLFSDPQQGQVRDRPPNAIQAVPPPLPKIPYHHPPDPSRSAVTIPIYLFALSLVFCLVLISVLLFVVMTMPSGETMADAKSDAAKTDKVPIPVNAPPDAETQATTTPDSRQPSISNHNADQAIDLGIIERETAEFLVPDEVAEEIDQVVIEDESDEYDESDPLVSFDQEVQERTLDDPRRAAVVDQQLEEPTLVELIAKVELSVVRIVTTKTDVIGTGSGFVIDNEGKVATNHHVIANASSAKVQFADGSQALVTGILATDESRDIAILQIDKKDSPAPPLSIATSIPKKGEKVLALGSPLGLSFSASDGIVSAIRPGPEVTELVASFGASASYEGTWIQTTTPISKGNSGGPLIDSSGTVVGLNTLTFNYFGGENINFAISASDIKRLVEEAEGAELIALEQARKPSLPTTAASPLDPYFDYTKLAVAVVVKGAESVSFSQSELEERSMQVDLEDELRRQRFNVPSESKHKAGKVVFVYIHFSANGPGFIAFNLLRREVQDGVVKHRVLAERKMTNFSHRPGHRMKLWLNSSIRSFSAIEHEHFPAKISR